MYNKGTREITFLVTMQVILLRAEQLLSFIENAETEVLKLKAEN